MMGQRSGGHRQLFYSFNLDDHVPSDHLLRGVDQFLDLGDLHQHLAPFYSHTGRPSIDPQLLIRMLIVGYCFGSRSERRLCEELRHRHERGKDFSIVVVSEGYELEGMSEAKDVDQFGHIRLSERGVGAALAHEIEARTGYETRVTVLGHVQRGGSPTPRDRVLATRFGLKAADLVESGSFGRMAALRGDGIVDVSLKEATAELKTVPEDWYEVAKAFFG